MLTKSHAKKTVVLNEMIQTGDIVVSFERGTIQTRRGIVLLSMDEDVFFNADIRIMQKRLADKNSNYEKAHVAYSSLFTEEGDLKPHHTMAMLAQSEIELNACIKEKEDEVNKVRPTINEMLIYRYWDIIKHKYSANILEDTNKYLAYRLVKSDN